MIADAVMATMVELVALLLAALLPQHAVCRDGWHLDMGVRVDGPDVGSYSCAPPLPLCCEDAAGPCEHVKCPDRPREFGRIYCTNGTIPIVVNERTVGCQRAVVRYFDGD